MDDDIVIRAKDIGKLYRIGELAPYQTLRDALAQTFISPFRKREPVPDGRIRAKANPGPDGYIWALRNVSFDVRQGEAVGFVGPNGAGKTTLLKVLSRITEPTEGWAQIRGRMSSLLEVGTGFHPELTGRENVYLNGAVLGMRKVEIARKFEDIVKFAEVEKFIDTPVKWYSDGMRVRLGFAVAAHLEPEILVVDEVLAVGDAAFQRKCMGRMEDIATAGRTVLFVSHNMAAIQNLCTVAFALDHGQVIASGDVNDVIQQYLERYDRPSTTPLRDRTDRTGTGKVRITNLSIGGRTNAGETVQCGARIGMEIAYEGASSLEDVDIDLLFFDQLGQCVLLAGATIQGKGFRTAPSKGRFVCRFEKFPLLAGVYHVNVAISVRGQLADLVKDAMTLHVVEGDFYGSGKIPPRGYGQVAVPYEWTLEN